MADVPDKTTVLGYAARIVNILPGATCARAVKRLPMIVKLKGKTHDIIALPLQ